MITRAEKHTPGPWGVEGGEITTSRGNVIGEVRMYGVWFNATTDGPTPYGTDNPGWKANARLIAAAPDLLRSAKLAISIISQHYPDGSNCCDAKINFIRAAIAKAEGRE